jgi:hypothetical protein
MNTQLSTTRFSAVQDNSNAGTTTRSKVMSAADVWNIQRNKKNRVQRRFAL